jgi:hypothetical protein
VRIGVLLSSNVQRHISGEHNSDFSTVCVRFFTCTQNLDSEYVLWSVLLSYQEGKIRECMIMFWQNCIHQCPSAGLNSISLTYSHSSTSQMFSSRGWNFVHRNRPYNLQASATAVCVLPGYFYTWLTAVNVSELTLYMVLWNVILVFLCRNCVIILKYVRFEVLTVLLLLLTMTTTMTTMMMMTSSSLLS